MTVKDIHGKMVDIDIPSNVFPTMEDIAAIDAVVPNSNHGWYPSVSKHQNGVPYDLHYRYWEPKGEPKGVLIYTHGVHSHSGHGSRIDGRPLDVVSCEEIG